MLGKKGQNKMFNPNIPQSVYNYMFREYVKVEFPADVRIVMEANARSPEE